MTSLQKKDVGGNHTAPSVQNPLQTPRQIVQKTGTVGDKTTCKETIIPKALSILHHMTFWADPVNSIN